MGCHPALKRQERSSYLMGDAVRDCVPGSALTTLTITLGMCCAAAQASHLQAEPDVTRQHVLARSPRPWAWCLHHVVVLGELKAL